MSTRLIHVAAVALRSVVCCATLLLSSTSDLQSLIIQTIDMLGSGYHRAVGASDCNDAAPARMETSTVPMSVVKHANRIAFAAYNEETNQIILEECIVADYETHDMAERVVAAVRPSLLLLSSKIVGDNDLLEALCTPPPNPHEGLADGEAAEGSNDAPVALPLQSSIPYRLMKTSSFDLRKCKANILKLQVRSLMRQSTEASTGLPNHPRRRCPMNDEYVFKVSSFHSLATVIDFESTVQVQAVGSLLSFLHTTAFRFEEGGNIFVNDIVRANASLYMTVSEDTLSALHIFATEHHPLVAAKGSGNSKEGFSLFSLLDHTKSRAGRQQLREWMLKPLVVVEAISSRQDGVELFLMPDMQKTAGSILSFLERIGAVDKILIRIQKCSAKHNDILVLAKSLSSAVAILDTLQEEILWKLHQRLIVEPSVDEQTSQQMFPVTWQLDPNAERYIAFTTALLKRCDVASLQILLERIASIIDEKATFECKSIVIQPGHHEQLDAFKQQFDRLEGKSLRFTLRRESFLSSLIIVVTYFSFSETLEGVGAALAQRMPHLRDLMDVIFLPQVRRTVSLYAVTLSTLNSSFVSTQVGFLVALQDQLEWSEQGILTEDFKFVFTEAGKSFFKNSEVRELDETIGDLDAVSVN